MRLLIAGNSHLAALKRAWDHAEGVPLLDAETTFFGSHQNSLRHVHCVDGRFTTNDASVRRAIAMTTGLKDAEVVIDNFDCHLLHGLHSFHWVIPYALRANSHRRSFGSITSSLIRAVVCEIIDQSLLLHMVAVIRKASDAPIIASPQPFRSSEILTSSRGKPYVGHEQLDRSLVSEFADVFDEMLQKRASENKVQLLPQPAETVVAPCFTNHKYCMGSVRLTDSLNIKHSDDDFDHMNEAYGALVLRDMAAYVRQSLSGL